MYVGGAHFPYLIISGSDYGSCWHCTLLHTTPSVHTLTVNTAKTLIPLHSDRSHSAGSRCYYGSYDRRPRGGGMVGQVRGRNTQKVTDRKLCYSLVAATEGGSEREQGKSRGTLRHLEHQQREEPAAVAAAG